MSFQSLSFHFLTTCLMVAFYAAIGQSLTETELDAYLALWQSQDNNDYVMSFRRTCFCSQCFIFEKVIQVTDSNVTSVEYKDESQIEECTDPNFPDYLDTSLYTTIDELFDILYDNIEDAETIIAIFDAELGYPKNIYIDISSNLADEEIVWNIDCLVLGSSDANDCRADIPETTDAPDTTESGETGTSASCDDGRTATLSLDGGSVIVCSELVAKIRRREEVAGTVCVTFDKGTQTDVLVTFETESSALDEDDDWRLRRISLYFDDEEYLAERRIVNYNQFDYQSGRIDETVYQWSIPLSTFTTLDDICDYCDSRTFPRFYLKARVGLRLGRRRYTAIIDTIIGTLVECVAE